MNPLVSVVIPSYNMAALTPLSVESVLAQDYPRIEVIVVDDGSADGSVEALKRFGGRIRLIEQKNAGACAARNRGLKECSGEFVAFLDCDDLWEPEKLSRCVEKLKARPRLGMVHSFAYWIDAEGRVFGPPRFDPKPAGRIFDELVLGDFVVNSTPLIRREALDAVGAWDESIFTTADWDLWLRLAEKFEIGFIPAVLARTRVASYYNARNIEQTRREWLHVLAKYDDRLSSSAKARGRANMHFYLSRLHSANRDFSAAGTEARAGLELAPDDKKLRAARLLYSLGRPANVFLSRILQCYTWISCRWNILRQGSCVHPGKSE